MDDFRRFAEAAALTRQGRGREALTRLVGHAFVAALELPALLLHAEILDQLNELAASWHLYESALKLFPNDALVLLRAGVSSYRRGDLSKAEMLLRRSWHVATLPETAYYLSRVEDVQGQQGRACEYLAFVIGAESQQGFWRQRAVEMLAAAVDDPAPHPEPLP